MWQGPQAPVPSRHPAHAGSGSSAPTQGPDGTALNSSGTPLPHVWASLLEHGCPLSPRGPSRRQLGSYGFIRVTTPVQSLSRCSAPSFSRHLNPHPPWSLMGRPDTLWFNEFLYPLMEPRGSHVPGKQATTGPRPQPFLFYFIPPNANSRTSLSCPYQSVTDL